MNNNNIFKFVICEGSVRVVCRVEEHWVEFTYYVYDGSWFRKFVSKAGYTGPNDLRGVACDIWDANVHLWYKLAR